MRNSKFIPHKLFIGCIFAHMAPLCQLKKELRLIYGAIDAESVIKPFDYTDYYTAEMGKGLKRAFFSFSRLVLPDRLADIKIATNEMEQEFATAGKRSVNIDPGILSLDNIVLASAKNHSHRIPLCDGIYGEVTLRYAGNNYTSLPWTYADYRDPDFLAFFSGIRKKLYDELKQKGLHTRIY